MSNPEPIKKKIEILYHLIRLFTLLDNQKPLKQLWKMNIREIIDWDIPTKNKSYSTPLRFLEFCMYKLDK